MFAEYVQTFLVESSQWDVVQQASEFRETQSEISGCKHLNCSLFHSAKSKAFNTVKGFQRRALFKAQCNFSKRYSCGFHVITEVLHKRTGMSAEKAPGDTEYLTSPHKRPLSNL